MTSEPKTNEPILKVGDVEETTVGNYFVSNYPPFSFWRSDRTVQVHEVLAREPDPETPFGLYIHIPFCRRRCDFCYFRVYTGREARSVDRYSEALIGELGQYAERQFIRGRKPLFVYFGGGTPSFLSVEQLQRLFDGLRGKLPWDDAEEVTFECEPGTLDEEKIKALRDLGVTRLSLGVENFDPDILALNNRAHRAKEIEISYQAARGAGFPQINIDIIAGMVGETEENWQHCIEKTVAMAPESATVYQMEIPYNTTVSQRMKDGGTRIAPVADWSTKRRWVDEAFRELEANGYTVGSAYTAVKEPSIRFLYRDGLWRGSDMLGLGVASFSHLGGVHFQNEHHLDPYVDIVEGGELPLHRALKLTEEEKLIRELILQLKLGTVEVDYFTRKFGVDVRSRFKGVLEKHERDGFLSIANGRIELSRAGLLQVDRLLPEFFLKEHRGARYT